MHTMEYTTVPGKQTAQITLYALSTCGWCRKTKEYLASLGVAYRYVYVDLLSGDERKEAIDMVKALNPSLSFPTMTVGEKVIIGYNEDEIQGAL